MLRVLAIAALATLNAEVTEAAVAAKPCGTAANEHYARLAALPPEVVRALAPTMAEKGAKYQIGDVIYRRELPLYRFVGADRSGCWLTVEYEQGGFAHRWGKFVFERMQDTWTRLVPK